MKNLFKTILALLVLAIVVSVALEIKRYVTEPKKEQPEISVQPERQSTHRNIACRIQRKSFPKYNKIGLL